MADQMSPEHEDRRNDLLAMLAAGRELGPDMDTSLVDSYLGRQTAQEKSRQRTVVPQSGASRLDLFSQYRGVMVFVAVFGAVAVAATVMTLVFANAGGQQGEHGFWFPWLFFPLIFFVFWGRRGYYRGHRRHTYDTDDGRRVTVYERMRAYGAYGPYDRSGDSPADRPATPRTDPTGAASTPPPRPNPPRDIEYD
jgi:hypothetical protein